MTASNIITKQVHISTIQPGDTVMHNDKMHTVCRNNIGHDSFMGKSIFGDCYHSGHKLVTLVKFAVPTISGVRMQG